MRDTVTLWLEAQKSMPKLKSFQSPVEILRTYNVKFSLDYLFHSFFMGIEVIRRLSQGESIYAFGSLVKKFSQSESFGEICGSYFCLFPTKMKINIAVWSNYFPQGQGKSGSLNTGLKCDWWRKRDDLERETSTYVEEQGSSPLMHDYIYTKLLKWFLVILCQTQSSCGTYKLLFLLTSAYTHRLLYTLDFTLPVLYSQKGQFMRNYIQN